MESSRGTGTVEPSMALRGLARLPPFLLGAVAATAAELSAGLLLYSTEGFLRALTVVLATETAALGVGLASSAHLEHGDVPAVRRRWILVLVAFGLAAGFSAAWGLGEGFSAVPVSQGLGLALLGGFPLYASGAALGALGAAEDDDAGGGARRGAAAALGAAAGVLLTGLLAVPDLEPTSVYLFCVVGVSIGALAHGWLVDRRVLVRTLARLPDAEPGGFARLEERFRPGSEESVRVLRVRGRTADGTDGEGRLLLPWQRGVVELLGRRSGRIDRVLLVGIGTGALPRELRSAVSPRRIVAEEPWESIRTLVGSAPEAPGAREGRREPDAPDDGGNDGERNRRFDAVVVNLRLLPGAFVPGEALPILERAAQRRSDDGILALGGLEPGGRAGEDADEVVRWVADRGWAPAITLLRPAANEEDTAVALLAGEPDRGGWLVLGGPSVVGTGLLEIAGMRPVETGPRAAAGAGGGRAADG